MGIFLGWFVFSIIVGAIGADRKIGFWSSFLLSLILSPLIGLILTLVSESKSTHDYKKKLLKLQEENLHYTRNQEPEFRSIIDELEKLSSLREKEMISDKEFFKLKSDLLGNGNNEIDTTEPIYYFNYEIEDMDVPSEIENELNVDSEYLLDRIKAGEKTVESFQCKEYPFYAALVLEKRKVEMSGMHIKQLEFLAEKFFQCKSINDALQKIKESNTSLPHSRLEN